MKIHQQMDQQQIANSNASKDAWESKIITSFRVKWAVSSFLERHTPPQPDFLSVWCKCSFNIQMWNLSALSQSAARLSCSADEAPAAEYHIKPLLILLLPPERRESQQRSETSHRRHENELRLEFCCHKPEETNPSVRIRISFSVDLCRFSQTMGSDYQRELGENEKKTHISAAESSLNFLWLRERNKTEWYVIKGLHH